LVYWNSQRNGGGDLASRGAWRGVLIIDKDNLNTNLLYRFER
jgi:hypothetical protein